MRKKRKKIIKRHKVKTGESVQFKHAGTKRIGSVTELTKDPDGSATYTVEAHGIIYPCLGINGSKWTGYIIV